MIPRSRKGARMILDISNQQRDTVITSKKAPPSQDIFDSELTDCIEELRSNILRVNNLLTDLRARGAIVEVVDPDGELGVNITITRKFTV
jgi:hypothetical protein